MRLFFLTGAALAALASTAAADGCYRASEDILTVTEWSAEAGQGVLGKTLKTAITVKSNAKKAVRMIDARVSFADALGNEVTTVQIGPDVQISPGEAHTFKQEVTPLGSDGRLASVVRDDVHHTVCTRAVVYTDGEVERFDAEQPKVEQPDEVDVLLKRGTLPGVFKNLP